MEIRREYIEPIARQFPEIQVIPYIIPGRTGTQLYPQDLGNHSSAIFKRSMRKGSHWRFKKHGVNPSALRRRLRYPIRR